MTTIDYMKVIDTISDTLGAVSARTMDAVHDKIDRFDCTVPLSATDSVQFSLYLHKYYLLFTMKKVEMSERDFEKWLSRFEYQLEQQFVRNIRLEKKESVTEYRIEIHF